MRSGQSQSDLADWGFPCFLSPDQTQRGSLIVFVVDNWLPMFNPGHVCREATWEMRKLQETVGVDEQSGLMRKPIAEESAAHCVKGLTGMTEGQEDAPCWGIARGTKTKNDRILKSSSTFLFI
jgi:hypothetical protein